MIGADVAQLHDLGRTLESKPEEIDVLISTVSGAFANTAWTGPARDHFETNWQSFKTALTNLQEAFRAAGKECHSRADLLQQSMT